MRMHFPFFNKSPLFCYLAIRLRDAKEEQMVKICLYVHVRVAPPMIVGAWSMAVQ